ncbi:MAG: hypothetical protein P8K77_06825 [Polaribacter sp.]|nr:hypothetical protein [Polaribacter sp.]
MKTYSRYTFFKHTYCEYKELELNFFTECPVHYKSKTGSLYSYTKEGVYRYSNHWGRVADCRWKLLVNKAYKNQTYRTGFAKWTDFYPINETEKLFYIEVDFNLKKANFQYKTATSEAFLFTAIAAQKRIRQIHQLFSSDTWANYFEQPIDVLRKALILELVNSNKTLQQVKMELNQ